MKQKIHTVHGRNFPYGGGCYPFFLFRHQAHGVAFLLFPHSSSRPLRVSHVLRNIPRHGGPFSTLLFQEDPGQLQKSVDALGGGLTKIYCQVVYEERNKVCTFAT